MSGISDRLNEITERMVGACVRAGRGLESVQLMAVSKFQTAELIEEAGRIGLRLFGESRVQEARARRDSFPTDAQLHLIGHLQRNKARDAVELFDAIDSIDAMRTAEAVADRLRGTGRIMPILLEVNTSGEPSKQGVEGESELLRLADGIASLPELSMYGLMTIGPISQDETILRRAFASLHTFRDTLERHLGRSLPELSMGMSNDLEAAILEGATTVRIGTALFGVRA